MAELGRIDRRTYDAIQREQSRRAALLFFLLSLIYLLAVLVFYVSIKGVLFGWSPIGGTHGPFFGWKDLALVTLMAVLGAGLHWILARTGMVERLLRILGAQEPDEDDSYHRRFGRVVDELRIAADLPPIRCVIIPNATANAFAIDDSKEHPIIGVTEGLLARLSRPQLQAVCAHEVAHVLRQDCRLATLCCALVGVLLAMLEYQRGEDERGRSRISPFYPVFVLLYAMGQLLNLAISRKREYLADATAVELTRDPLALAGALKAIARAPRGAAPDGLAPLFIAGSDFEELEGSRADWFTTHPPLRHRVAALLETAGLGPIQARRAAAEEAEARAPSDGTAPARYLAFDEQERQWIGPLSPVELAATAWVGPITWLTPEGGKGAAAPAATIAAVMQALSGRPELSGGACPRCGVGLVEEEYEGTQIERCGRCGGCLAREDRVARILVRRDAPMGPEVQRLAARFQQSTRLRPRRNAQSLDAGLPPPACPRCQRPMFTRFYSYQYFVEIDRCGACGVIWFDRDELEILQALVEGAQSGP